MTGPDDLRPEPSADEVADDVTCVWSAPSQGQGGDELTRVLGAGGATQPGAGAPQPGQALPTGARLAEFEVTGLIGQGGFGVVYEAWDHALERSVAIKEYLPTSLAHRLADGTVVPLSTEAQDTFQLGMRSFINEARLLAQFDHPSLLKVYRFWEEGGTAYMVMPRYHGRTLRQALDAQPGPPSQAWLLGILDGVSQALDVMHASQCFHRDIAPDNILLQDDTGLPVVLDFGAARRVITDRSQAVTVILKPGYAPVEQYGDMPDASQGAWTDVYALAAVAHYAICRKVPPPSVGRMLHDGYQPLAGNAALLAHYSAGLLGAIDQGLAVRPQDRPQSMRDFRRALGLEGAEARPQPIAASSTGGSASRARGTGMARWALGGVLVAVLAGAGWFLLRPVPASEIVAASGGPPVAGPPASSDPETRAAAEDIAPPAPAAPPPPVPAPAPPRNAAASMAALGAAATPGFEVAARSAKREVVIGKDELSFEVRSNRDGYVYVMLLSSDGELFMLFPNLLDKHNRISAGTSLTLPRASWAMKAGGPAGVNRFAVVVSTHERDFADTGLRHDGVFPQFSLPLLEALEAEAARKGDGTPLLGTPICPPQGSCVDGHGVAHFEILEK